LGPLADAAIGCKCCVTLRDREGPAGAQGTVTGCCGFRVLG